MRSGVPQYLFGEAEQLQLDRDIVYEKLTNLLSLPDESGGYRNIILVGHNIMCDVALLRNKLGINLKDIPTIRAILDTQRLVCDLHSLSRARLALSLQQTLIHLGVRYMYLHNSGNDAHFTLKVLLLLFCKWKGEKELYNFGQYNETEKMFWQERLQVLTRIGRHWSGVILKRPIRNKTGKGKGRSEKMPKGHDIWTEGSDR